MIQSANQLLKELDSERRKDPSDKEKIKKLIQKLIDIGEYPAQTVPGNPSTIEQMVTFWGTYWHRWIGELECPSCHVDLRDHENGPPFTRQTGIYSRELDRTVSWKCPDCGYEWKRT